MTRRVLAGMCGVILAGLTLSGCGLDHGTIIAKNYDEGYYYNTFQCVSINNNNACGMQMPIVNYQPPCWRLDLAEGDDTGSVCVDESTWDRMAVGQRWG